MSTSPEPRRPWYRRTSWVLVIAAVVIVIVAALFATFARGEAVDEVSLGMPAGAAPIPVAALLG